MPPPLQSSPDRCVRSISLFTRTNWARIRFRFEHERVLAWRLLWTGTSNIGDDCIRKRLLTISLSNGFGLWAWDIAVHVKIFFVSNNCRKRAYSSRLFFNTCPCNSETLKLPWRTNYATPSTQLLGYHFPSDMSPSWIREWGICRPRELTGALG